MKKDRMNGILIGLFYIVAAISAVIAVVLYQPLLSEDWCMATVKGSETAILVGVMNDILLIVAAVGTAVMLFPYVRLWNEHSALAYLCFRFMEAVFIAIGLVSILGLLSLSSNHEVGNIAIEEIYHHIGSVLQSFHSWTSVLGPNLMLGLNTLLYSYLLYKTEIVPKRLAIFGMLTAVMVFLAGLLDMFDIIGSFSTIKGLIALPLGIYELSLATWLIVKGFNAEKLEKLRESKR